MEPGDSELKDGFTRRPCKNSSGLRSPGNLLAGCQLGFRFKFRDPDLG